MKKQQKRKKQMKNRPGGRQRTRPKQSRRAHQQSAQSRKEVVRGFKNGLEQARGRLAAGDLSGWLADMLDLLSRSKDPSLRQTFDYWDAEADVATVVRTVSRHLFDATDLQAVLDYRGPGLSRHLSLHIQLAVAEALIAKSDAQGARKIAEDVLSNISGTERVHRGGTSFVRNVLAHRLYELGDFEGADYQWQLIMKGNSDVGLLDGPSYRLLAANSAATAWRAGKEARAIEVLRAGIEQAPAHECDHPMSLHPFVGYVELLRSSGAADEAETALAHLTHLLQQMPPIEAPTRSESLEELIEEARSAIRTWDTRSAGERTYFPAAVREQGSPFSRVMFYGESPGVYVVPWCTPEELLLLHGVDDELVIASIRLLIRAVSSQANLLAIQQLIRVRELLAEMAPESPLIQEIVEGERDGLAKVSAV